MSVPAQQVVAQTAAFVPKPTDARAAMNRAYAAAQIREKLKGGVILNALRNIDAELRAIGIQLRRGTPAMGPAGQPIEVEGAQVTRDMTPAEERRLVLRLQVLKQRADLNFKKLAKILPDLRSVEVTDPSGANPLEPLLNAMRDAARDGGDEGSPMINGGAGNGTGGAHP